MTFARRSLILLGIQLAIVSSIAAKYLYQRTTCPKVWTRAVAYDPEMVMRGRYISAQIYIDSCGVSLPQPARNSNVGPREILLFEKNGISMPYLNAKIGTKNGKLVTLQIVDEVGTNSDDQRIELRSGSDCSESFLQQPVDFYLSESAKSPFPLVAGQQLWVEVTVPPKGPPRPLGLALKSADGTWQPLNYR